MTTAYQRALIRQAVQDVWNEGWTARKNRCGPVFTILRYGEFRCE